MKKILLFASLLISLTTINKAHAEGEFQTEYNITYKVTSSGETQVSYDISIANQKVDVIATKYSLSLKQMNIYDISGTDKEGKLDITKSIDGDVTTITATLNEQAIGINKKNNLTISFKTKNVASKVGEIWNINIPQVQNIDSTSKYDVSLYIPPQFGPTIFVSPYAEEKIQSDGSRLYQLDKEKLRNTGIAASYGKYQVLNFRLRYQLSNDSIVSKIQEIALPPDIKDRQQIYYKDLKPAPIKITTDKDGNTLAHYKVSSKQKLEVEVIGSARIMGKQISSEFGSTMARLPRDLVRSYTRDQKYWEKDSGEIEGIAKSLLNKDLTVSQNAQAAYNYVISNLSYDFETAKNNFIERKGALGALSQKDKSACMEFTDLFISIVRAMGIPARELNGYAFTQADGSTPLSVNLKGGDLLHAWAEYYDPNYGWVAVDPTWGATSKMDYFTKLDTNHFVFVVKGLSSEYPLPAGAYRTDDRDKLVDIDFANSEDQNFAPIESLEQAKGFVQEQAIPVYVITIIIGAAILFVGSFYFFLFKRKS